MQGPLPGSPVTENGVTVAPFAQASILTVILDFPLSLALRGPHTDSISQACRLYSCLDSATDKTAPACAPRYELLASQQVFLPLSPWPP